MEVKLIDEVKEVLAPIVNTNKNHVFTKELKSICSKYKNINSENLQTRWTSIEMNNDVFNFLDEVGNSVKKILEVADLQEINSEVLTAILNVDNKKLKENKKSVLTGLYFLSSINKKLFDN